MAKQQSGTDSNKSLPATHVEYGEFPFPLTDRALESEYLTWIRNNSNYMAVRGFLDYLRSIGVLVRGIIVNFLIILPYLLFVALILGYFHHWLLEHPYYVTMGVLAIGLAWIILFPNLILLYKIFGYKRSLETGSDSSVKRRDIYERSFGGLLLVILTVAVLESLPWVLELLHDQIERGTVGWKGGVASVVAALALLSGSDKLLSVLSGAKKKLAMVLIGILGLLVPLLVVLYATAFLVYGRPPTPTVMYSPLAMPVFGVLWIIIAIPLGIYRQTFSVKECAGLAGLLVAGLFLTAAVVAGGNSAAEQGEKAYQELEDKIEPLQRVAAACGEISNKQEMTPEVASLIGELAVVEHEHKTMESDVLKERNVLESQADEANETWQVKLPSYNAWKSSSKYAEFEGRYFASGQRFITLGDRLSAQPRGSLEPLRREIAMLSFDRLLEEIRKEDADNDEYVTNLLRNKLVERYLAQHLTEYRETSSPEDSDTKDFAAEVGQVRRRLEELGKHIQPLDLVKKATVSAKAALQISTVEEIAKLAGEEQLANRVEQEFKELPGKAKLTRLAGKEELAKLLRKDSIVDLLLDFSQDDPTELGRTTLIEKAIEGDLTPDQQAEVRLKLAVLGGFDMSSSDVDFATSREVRSADTRRGGVTLRSEPAPTAKSSDANNEKPSELDVTDAQIAEAARKVLARLALSDFNAKQLAIVAKHRNFYETINDLSELNEPEFEDFDKQKFKERQYDTQVAREHTLKELVELLDLETVDDDVAEGKLLLPDYRNLLLAQKSLRDKDKLIERLAREILADKALAKIDTRASDLAAAVKLNDANDAHDELGKLCVLTNTGDLKHPFSAEELAKIAVAKLTDPDNEAPDKLIATLMFGKHAPLERSEKDPGSLESVKKELSQAVMPPKAIFISLLAAVVWLGCWFTVDVNQTSIHGLYRDRLASAFLVGQDTQGDVDIEEDIDLQNICRYEARSTAPYHLINVALNLQGSKDPSVRDRNSDFFIFSKRFIGGERTGYCRTETMEQVFPQMNLATAMAISAAAASPNMGRGTSPLLVTFMTLLNIRLGYWMPNPGFLEEQHDKARRKLRKKDAKLSKQPPGFEFEEIFSQEFEEIQRRWQQAYPSGFLRQSMISEEFKDCLAEYGYTDEVADSEIAASPTVKHRLVGIAFSGGGIRSAAINLGITQSLQKRGVFEHIDYMSTVSGGGYLGSSISTLMRSRTKLVSEVAGAVKIQSEQLSEIAGKVSKTSEGKYTKLIVKGEDGKTKEYKCSQSAEVCVAKDQTVREKDVLFKTTQPDEINQNAGDQFVTVEPSREEDKAKETVPHQFSKDAKLNVRHTEGVFAGKLLLKPRDTLSQSEISGKVSVHKTITKQKVTVLGKRDDGKRTYEFSRFEQLSVKSGETVKRGQSLIKRRNTFGERFWWGVPPRAFLREMRSKLDETYPWVNLSDGGHLENLATMELLRRRCKYIIIGDGEADPEMHFSGLATLMRCAYLDLGIKIKIELDDLRLRKDKKQDRAPISREHWAIGRIKYPKTDRVGEEVGYLLYLKSSYTGDEIEVIQEYRRRNPNFPHQTTADQFFDEGQFEAYRALGQHIAEQALPKGPDGEIPGKEKMSYSALKDWLEGLWIQKLERDKAERERKKREHHEQTQASEDENRPDTATTNKPATEKKTVAKKSRRKKTNP